jgi:hypothetical protein
MDLFCNSVLAPMGGADDTDRAAVLWAPATTPRRPRGCVELAQQRHGYCLLDAGEGSCRGGSVRPSFLIRATPRFLLLLPQISAATGASGDGGGGRRGGFRARRR